MAEDKDVDRTNTETEKSHCDVCEGIKQIGIDACQGCSRRE